MPELKDEEIKKKRKLIDVSIEYKKKFYKELQQKLAFLNITMFYSTKFR
jgi:hypothetical protein